MFYGTFKFVASTTGRIVRVVAGLGLIAWGLLGGGGLVPAIIGLVPLAAGMFDWCVFAPLFGAPFKGCDIRNA